jgi:hypothetical protein
MKPGKQEFWNDGIMENWNNGTSTAGILEH